MVLLRLTGAVVGYPLPVVPGWVRGFGGFDGLGVVEVGTLGFCLGEVADVLDYFVDLLGGGALACFCCCCCCCCH